MPLKDICGLLNTHYMCTCVVASNFNIPANECSAWGAAGNKYTALFETVLYCFPLSSTRNKKLVMDLEKLPMKEGR